MKALVGPACASAEASPLSSWCLIRWRPCWRASAAASAWSSRRRWAARRACWSARSAPSRSRSTAASSSTSTTAARRARAAAYLPCHCATHADAALASPLVGDRCVCSEVMAFPACCLPSGEQRKPVHACEHALRAECQYLASGCAAGGRQCQQWSSRGEAGRGQCAACIQHLRHDGLSEGFFLWEQLRWWPCARQLFVRER